MDKQIDGLLALVNEVDKLRRELAQAQAEASEAAGLRNRLREFERMWIIANETIEATEDQKVAAIARAEQAEAALRVCNDELATSEICDQDELNATRAALAQLQANYDTIPLDALRQIANESQLGSWSSIRYLRSWSSIRYLRDWLASLEA